MEMTSGLKAWRESFPRKGEEVCFARGGATVGRFCDGVSGKLRQWQPDAPAAPRQERGLGLPQ
jgi:hypothetical protein